MLNTTLLDIHVKLKIHFYQEMFKLLRTRETSLTTVETFCVEVIYALNGPTVAQFAKFISVSSPNAAYKVNNLTRKGYITKVRSETDKREYHLYVTEKFHNYYKLSSQYCDLIAQRAETALSPEELETLNNLLGRLSDECMEEVAIPSTGRKAERKAKEKERKSAVIAKRANNGKPRGFI